MPYSDTSIMIHLINNDKLHANDDTIRIRNNLDTNSFDITYVDQNGGSRITHNLSGLTHSCVLNYLYMLFKNQSLDEEGYKSVQLTLPALPRIIVSGEKFKDLYYREHFLMAIETGLEHIENVENVKLTVPSVHRTRYTYETPVSRRSTAHASVPQHLKFEEK
jgi:hypothetical protein